MARILSLSSSARFSFSLIPFSPKKRLSLPLSLPHPRPYPPRVYLGGGFMPLCSSTTTPTFHPIAEDEPLESSKHLILLERLRIRHLKDSIGATNSNKPRTPKQEQGTTISPSGVVEKKKVNGGLGKVMVPSSFEELGLSEEVMAALEEMGISVPTEIQSLGIAAVLEEKSVVLGSHTGSGKTLAYLLPLVQLLRRDEASYGMLMKPRRPRAVVLCPTRELCEQVFRVAKSISHHARFRSTMVSGGGRLRPQEDSLNSPIDMVVGTPGRVLQHIEEGNIVYGDIKYLVLDEADTMFDRGFGPDIRKFLGPLKNRALKSDDLGFQTVLVSATMTKDMAQAPSNSSPNKEQRQAVQELVDEEFQGIIHLRTSTLHKKIASARHDFVKLSGSENKLEALLQVLEPSLAKGNRVMVFCNTLNSSRAVDHFLSENQLSTVNYHGEVPAEQRVENLKKFKSDDGDCPTLVCTDLAARGLDLDVDHVIMFDFPLNSIDYLHRTGRTARMGAKGKITSLVAKKDLNLATRIEEALRKNESLESLALNNDRRDSGRPKLSDHKTKGRKLTTNSNSKTNSKAASAKSTSARSTMTISGKRNSGPKSGKVVAISKSKKPSTVKVSKPLSGRNLVSAGSTKRPVSASSPKRPVSGVKTRTSSKKPTKGPSKINVVGFRGRSSSSSRQDGLRSS